MRLSVILTSALVLMSCAGMSAQREMLPGNTFKSKMPDITVKFDETLRYKGTFKLRAMPSSEEQLPARVEKEYHVWFDPENHAGAVIIYYRLLETRFFWFENMFNKNDPRAFFIKREGSWQTRVGLTSPNEKEKTALHEMGVDFSRRTISKTWSKKTSSRFKTGIVYCEPYHGKSSDIIDAFVDRANNKVKILN